MAVVPVELSPGETLVNQLFPDQSQDDSHGLV
jgi:hypothetical protein